MKIEKYDFQYSPRLTSRRMVFCDVYTDRGVFRVYSGEIICWNDGSSSMIHGGFPSEFDEKPDLIFADSRWRRWDRYIRLLLDKWSKGLHHSGGIYLLQQGDRPLHFRTRGL